MPKRTRATSFSPQSREDSSPLSSTSAVTESLEAETGGSNSARPTKLASVDPDSGEDFQVKPVMQCSLPPHRHPVEFLSIDEFELHYAKDHFNRCSSCGKNFPTAHFLSLHIDENHNTLRQVLQSKGDKTYACFVEDCDRKCSTPQKRRLHLIDKHMFPRTYNFRVIDTGIDQSTSMLHENHRRRVSTTTDPLDSGVRSRRLSYNHAQNSISLQQQHIGKATSPSSHSTRGVDQGTLATTTPEITTIDDLEQSFSALRFVPPSVLNKQRQKKEG